MPKTDYDSESKLQLHPLIDAIEAAAANKDNSSTAAARTHA